MASKADDWGTAIGASPFVVKAVTYVIRDMPRIPFTEGFVFGEILQTEEDKEFAGTELEKRDSIGIFEEVGRQEVQQLVAEGKMVSSSFVV